MQKGTGGWKKIVKAFGDEILLDNGEIDRARLGQIVFSDPSKRQLLNRSAFRISFYECRYMREFAYTVVTAKNIFGRSA